MRVTGTRHAYGTADVGVADANPYTGPSRSTGTTTTIVPRSHYVEDEDDWGFRNQVTVIGRSVKKDGTLAQRDVRLTIKLADVPDDVWAALLTMRPDLTR